MRGVTTPLRREREDDAAPARPLQGLCENQRYEDLVWPERQLELLPFFFEDLTIAIPPCFFSSLSNRSLVKLDELVFTHGSNLLVVGGHSGADFISRFLAGEDGFGYVRSAHRDLFSLPKTCMDVVWTDGPFLMQEAAASTAFKNGYRILQKVDGDCGECNCRLHLHFTTATDSDSLLREYTMWRAGLGCLG